jgi:hypothetical protein
MRKLQSNLVFILTLIPILSSSEIGRGILDPCLYEWKQECKQMQLGMLFNSSGWKQESSG